MFKLDCSKIRGLALEKAPDLGGNMLIIFSYGYSKIFGIVFQDEHLVDFKRVYKDICQKLLDEDFADYYDLEEVLSKVGVTTIEPEGNPSQKLPYCSITNAKTNTEKFPSTMYLGNDTKSEDLPLYFFSYYNGIPIGYSKTVRSTVLGYRLAIIPDTDLEGSAILEKKPEVGLVVRLCDKLTLLVQVEYTLNEATKSIEDYVEKVDTLLKKTLSPYLLTGKYNALRSIEDICNALVKVSYDEFTPKTPRLIYK